MPDQPPKTGEKKLEVDTETLDNKYYRPIDIETSAEEQEEIDRIVTESLKNKEEYDFSGGKIDPQIVSQKNSEEEKPAETISMEFRKLADEKVIPEFNHLSWFQTTQGTTNRPEDKLTPKFIDDIIARGKDILQYFFGEAPLNDAQRTYVRDGVYKELERKELNIPFYKRSLEEFFGKVFLGLPTGFNCDEK